MDTPNVISLCGERRRGKDYLAKVLINELGAKRLSFSDEVRNLAMKVFPWFDAYDDSQKDKVYDHPYNVGKKTGRDILLLVGRVRDVDGSYFARSFLENQLKAAVEDRNQLYVITDFRTPEEHKLVIEPFNIPTIKVYRYVDPKEFPPQEFEEYIRNYKAEFGFLNEDGQEPEVNIVKFVNRLKETGRIKFGAKQ
jgi:hypothetical protein